MSNNDQQQIVMHSFNYSFLLVTALIITFAGCDTNNSLSHKSDESDNISNIKDKLISESEFVKFNPTEYQKKEV